jgi:hypothetical protein
LTANASRARRRSTSDVCRGSNKPLATIFVDDVYLRIAEVFC